jgi:hypothetical protein
MTLIQLTNTQTTILSAACARDHGLVFPVTASIKGGPVGNSLKSLLKRGLIEEIKASNLNTVWRHDEAGSLTLRATPLAYSALGIGEAEGVAPAVQPDLMPLTRRKGTKKAQLIAMLTAADGASINEIIAVTGWRAHTTRGVISGVLRKKLGLTILSGKEDGRGRVYRIVDTA